MCERARACGGRLHADGGGLDVPGQYDPILQRTVNTKRIKAETEEEMFLALGISPVKPELRECAGGVPVWISVSGKAQRN
jgi:hypothetical protein